MTVYTRDFTGLLKAIDSGGRVLIAYIMNPDGIISAYHVMRLLRPAARDEAVLKPVHSWRPVIKAPSEKFDLAIYLGVAPEEGVDASSSYAILYRRGPRLRSAIVLDPGVPEAVSIDAKLSLGAGDYHPLMAAASIVAVAWNASRENALYRRFMGEAGLDSSTDYWIPETVASNLEGVEEACKVEAASWYPRLFSYDTAEPAKSAFEDAMLASLRAQEDLEAEELASRLEGEAGSMCGWRLGRVDYTGFIHKRVARILWGRLREPVFIYGVNRCGGQPVFSLAGGGRGLVRIVEEASPYWYGGEGGGEAFYSGYLGKTPSREDLAPILCGGRRGGGEA
ncbi:hypothetical protein [Aeropyrum camini]|uniref:Uncharacterized protein n=1 Tax=Aeropyrum camini SY1 = JCM 12091 TaxID=1198449 RepID=U3TDM9_9CREN|nr:hypothetical protein [Aeropyrum camini]BAN90083.1 hypothetical protein ACAM_0614 [Aeropyrum camini SY1 = JCM 12091]